MSAKVLVVDDEQLIRWSLKEELSRKGYEVVTAEDGEEGYRKYVMESPDIVLLDIKMPKEDGLSVLEKIKTSKGDALVIMITALDMVETAVKAMKLGAYDYINKPFNLEEVGMIVEKALETSNLKSQLSFLKDEEKKGIPDIIGKSEKMARVKEMILKLAQSEPSSVLIEGASGVGKELVARSIYSLSSRRLKPFVVLNCAAIPENLLESELMGHEKGAFTDAKTMKKGLLEVADGGVLFLDEIGEMPFLIQSKLLRILEEKSFRRIGGIKDINVDIKIISATNKDLGSEAAVGKFRKDLYYRLQVIKINVPSLSERKEDISHLCYHFIERFNKEFKKNINGVTGDAMKILENYSWPGNVRELKNVIERSVILESGSILTDEHFPPEVFGKELKEEDFSLPRLPDSGVNLDEIEKLWITQALEQTSGNKTRAAKKLGISIDQLRYRMEKHGIKS